jgi:beta-phosphoglucomutase
MMQWINNYQLFLFDFDGLLVNTEEIHFLAYQRMLKSNGVVLTWDFDRYCQVAHYDPDGLRKQIYAAFPELERREPNWSVLYAEKKKAVIDLVKEGAVHLMPGVEILLTALQAANIKSCVATHSPDELVNAVRHQQKILDTIPYWITREDYTHPKPHPECYLKAIERFASKGDRIIGFEDTPRGIRALLATPAKPVLVCQARYPEIPQFIAQGVTHIHSLEDLKDVDA